MVPLSTDDDRQLRSIRLFDVSKGLECFDHSRKLFSNNCKELSLRDTVAVDDDSTWQRIFVFLIELQPFFHHELQIGYHLVDHQPCSMLNSYKMLTSFFVSWILILAGNWAKLSSIVATTAATDGVPLTEPGLGWVTSIPTNMVG